jgi:ubiquinone/menaquinone biosynthesis C-methylase UbiE
MRMPADSATAFDSLAADYDRAFSHTQLGAYYRERVQAIYFRYWPGDKNLLELNAGTGEDAIALARRNNRVLATDISRAMLNELSAKAGGTACGDRLQIAQLSLLEVDNLAPRTFDGVLSNFGGLNCISDYQLFARRLGEVVATGGEAILCVMGPLVPWEIAWFAFRGEFAKSVRRLRRGTRWRGIELCYPPPATLIAAMRAASFRLLERGALGVFMPPPYAGNRIRCCPRTLATLARLEEAVSGLQLAGRFADHYVLVFRKD